MKKFNTVFFVPRHETSWEEHKSLIYYIKKKKIDIQPVVIIFNSYSKNLISICKKNKIKYLNLQSQYENFLFGLFNFVEKSINPRLGLFFKKYKKIDNNIFISIFKILFYLPKLYLEKIIFLKVCNNFKPSLIILPGDRELSPIPPILNVAKLKEIKTLNISHNTFETEGNILVRKDDIGFFFKKKNKFVPLLNLIIGLFFKNYIKKTKYGEILFTKGWRILSLYLMGMSHKNPWVQGDSGIDYMVVENEEAKKKYIKLGLSKTKILNFGYTKHDDIYKGLKKRKFFKKKYLNFKKKKIITIFSIPPNFEDGIFSWEEHIKKMNSLIKVLIKFDIFLLISLHPKCSYTKYKKELYKNKKIKILSESLSKFFSLSDIFVSNTSAALKWAKLIGMKSIDINLLDIQLKSFKEKNLTYQVSNEKELYARFKNLYEIIKKDPNYLENNFSLIAKRNKSFDGTSSKRHVSFILDLIKKRKCKK